MNNLSVVLATYNEEENIARCLKAVEGLADEIVIADGTSKDRTVEIAKTFGAKVFVVKNQQIFHINKQIAIDKAASRWVLQLDADEVVSKGLKEEIKDIIKKDPEENGFWLPRKNYFLGRFLMKGGQYPDYTVRFYRNGKGRLPQKDVHEQAVIDGKVGYLKNALLHYPYKNFNAYFIKWDRYNRLSARLIREDIRGKSRLTKIFTAFGYLYIKPAHWFFTTYIRHKGFYDSWQGFVFSFMSALRFPVSYVRYILKKDK